MFVEDDKLIVVFGDFGVWIWEIVSGKFFYDVNVKGINVEEEFGFLDVNGGFVVYCVCNIKMVYVLNVKIGEEVCMVGIF